MDNKCAVVTGASRGIGAEIAKTLAQEGFNIIVNYHSSAQKALEIVKLCEEAGVKAYAYKADVSDYSQCKSLIDDAVEKFGSVDVLVNNAGITRDTLFLRMSEQQFDEVINANLKSVFNMSRLAAPIMFKKRSGRIINISSVAGVVGNEGQANYSAAKAGIIGITKTLAKELGSRNITVNAVAPGFIKTEMTEVLPENIKKSALSAISLKRFGKVSDVANLVAFLASENASYITGQVIVIDGGLAL